MTPRTSAQGGGTKEDNSTERLAYKEDVIREVAWIFHSRPEPIGYKKRGGRGPGGPKSKAFCGLSQWIAPYELEPPKSYAMILI